MAHSTTLGPAPQVAAGVHAVDLQEQVVVGGVQHRVPAAEGAQELVAAERLEVDALAHPAVEHRDVLDAFGDAGAAEDEGELRPGVLQQEAQVAQHADLDVLRLVDEQDHGFDGERVTQLVRELAAGLLAGPLAQDGLVHGGDGVLAVGVGLNEDLGGAHGQRRLQRRHGQRLAAAGGTGDEDALAGLQDGAGAGEQVAERIGLDELCSGRKPVGDVRRELLTGRDGRQRPDDEAAVGLAQAQRRRGVHAGAGPRDGARVEDSVLPVGHRFSWL